MKRIPKFLRNKYLLVTAFFVVWMLFFDRNNLFSQLQLRNELNEMKGKLNFYKQKIDEVNKEKEELFGSGTALEKFARETYMMKKDDEDLFVIVPDSTGK